MMSQDLGLMVVGGIVLGALLALATACGDAAGPAPASSPDAALTADAGASSHADAASAPMEEARSIQEARILHPRMLDVYTGVIKRSCSPNPGVCHNDNNYPDLRTPGGLLAAIDAPCNLDLPDPTQGWDACERAGDLIRFEDGFSARIAWIERLAPGRWRLGLAQPMRVTDQARPSFFTADGTVILAPVEAWNVLAERQLAQTTVVVNVAPEDGYLLDLIDATMRSIIGGDPNRNGTWGAERASHGRVVAPGNLADSYLWGRLTGTVPGTRMPLANQALSNADYAALACWIEQTGRDPRAAADATAPIDYDGCTYARSPMDPAL